MVPEPSCPESFAPQHRAISSVVTPQLSSDPALIDLKAAPEEIGTGTGLSISDPLLDWEARTAQSLK